MPRKVRVVCVQAPAAQAQAMHVPVLAGQGVTVPVADRASRKVRDKASASTRMDIRAMHRASRPITPTRASAPMARRVRQVARPAHAQAAPVVTVVRAAIAVPVVRVAHRAVPAVPVAVIAVAKMRHAQ